MYYFNPNRNRESGFCSIIVISADQSHMGQWTCAARLKGRDYESIDEFRITVFNMLAGTSGIMIVIISVIVILIFVVYTIQFKQNRRNPSRPFVAAYNAARNSLTLMFQSDSSSDTGSSVVFQTPRQSQIADAVPQRDGIQLNDDDL